MPPTKVLITSTCIHRIASYLVHDHSTKLPVTGVTLSAPNNYVGTSSSDITPHTTNYHSSIKSVKVRRGDGWLICICLVTLDNRFNVT